MGCVFILSMVSSSAVLNEYRHVEVSVVDGLINGCLGQFWGGWKQLRRYRCLPAPHSQLLQPHPPSLLPRPVA